ncbi:MAG: hypothetical protein KatS3mg010_0443 [Acidimicrobiia bacterium]|nr:MAG: hypothetical protein KatS3mg010_0443 [Acidimicrobiia bacterium]
MPFAVAIEATIGPFSVSRERSPYHLALPKVRTRPRLVNSQYPLPSRVAVMLATVSPVASRDPSALPCQRAVPKAWTRPRELRIQ